MSYFTSNGNDQHFNYSKRKAPIGKITVPMLCFFHLAEYVSINCSYLIKLKLVTLWIPAMSGLASGLGLKGKLYFTIRHISAMQTDLGVFHKTSLDCKSGLVGWVWIIPLSLGFHKAGSLWVWPNYYGIWPWELNWVWTRFRENRVQTICFLWWIQHKGAK